MRSTELSPNSIETSEVSLQGSCLVCLQNQNKSSKIRIFVPWISNRFSAIIDGILRNISECNHKIELVDVTDFSYPRWSVSVKEMVRKLPLSGSVAVKKLKRERHSLISVKESFQTPKWLEVSTASELRTKYGGELKRSFSWLVQLENFLSSIAAMSLFRILVKVDIEPDEIWIYPNGRFANQRAIFEASELRGVRSFCYEASRFPSKFYLRPYRSHDKFNLQTDFEVTKAQVSSRSKDAVEKWIMDRSVPQSSINPFASKFKPADFDKSNTENIILFFTSSRDELIGLGEQWTQFGWENQYQAFSAIGRVMRPLGFKTVLRVHPNLVNKSSKELQREFLALYELRREGFQIIGPEDSANSYDLASRATAVVVSSSTIGIEALALGVPVIVTANSYYDNLPSLILARRDSNLSSIPSKVQEVECCRVSQEALTWLAFNFDRDLPIGRIIEVKPTIAQSLRNFLHFDVASYHIAAWLVHVTTFISRKTLFRKISHL